MARLLALVVLVLGLGLAGAPASARQNDARLDSLFGRLHATDDPREALPIQNRIWEVWMRSESDTIDLLMSRGTRAMAQGSYGAALAVFDSIVDLDPDFAEGWNKRATVHYLMGNFSASVADIERTLALEPRHFGALSGLGLIYTALDDDNGALRAFRDALAVNPHLPNARERVKRLEKKLKGEGI